MKPIGPASREFLHGVASGDPLTDRVVLWTRVTTEEESVPVEWALARDAALTDVVARGTATAHAANDHTVHVDPDGLEPDTTYHYRFATGASVSPTGRTKTLPADCERLRFAICSCAKFNAGFFNAYAAIAEHERLDFLLHLGDYIYEASNTPPKSQTPGADIGRPFDPLGECRTLADYRRRYAQYRRDVDVQRLHLRLPMIATLDDHELADGAWAGGSTEHDPEMSDPQRTMLGAEQRDWLLRELESSQAAWRIVATPSVFTRTWCEEPQELLHTALAKLKLIDEDGEGPDHDQWDGYPAERARLTGHLRDRAIENVVFLSADIHVGVAAVVTDAVSGLAVGVEMTAPSLTSQNLDDKLGL
jgi:alkaline phosphatase D